jgi:hypothetical protein
MQLKESVLVTLIVFAALLVVGCSVKTTIEKDEPNDIGPILWLGGSYIGEIENALPHGTGSWVHPDGYDYDGEWEYGLKSGYGVWNSPDGDHYDGHWKDNLKCGIGLFIGSSGEKYEGEWQDDLYHGHGTWSNANGDEYIGEFVMGLFHGNGTWIGSDGGKYEGGFAYGEKHGEGLLTGVDGSVDKGPWVEGTKIPTKSNIENSQSSADDTIASIDGPNANLVVTSHSGKAMRFFESGSTPAEYGSRKYATKFNSENVEYIYFEVIVTSQAVSVDREFSINFRSNQLGLDYTENYKIPAGQNQVVITGPSRGKIFKPDEGTYVVDIYISNIKPDPGLFGAKAIDVKGSFFKVG